MDGLKIGIDNAQPYEIRVPSFASFLALNPLFTVSCVVLGILYSLLWLYTRVFLESCPRAGIF